MSTTTPQADSETNSVRTDVITRDNHYVPRLYLKHFASESGYLYRYRTLVSKPTVAEWKRVNIGGVGYQSHLYTRALAYGDSDEIEQWLNRDFETPAESSIHKAVNNERLGKEDYRLLIRFLAAQIVRTPAYLIENLPRWQEWASSQLKESLLDVRKELERGERNRPANSKYTFPKLRILSSPCYKRALIGWEIGSYQNGDRGRSWNLDLWDAPPAHKHA